MKLVQCKRFDIDFGIAVKVSINTYDLLNETLSHKQVKPLEVHNLNYHHYTVS